MKKFLLAIIALCSLPMYAYRIEVKNDTKDTELGVEIKFAGDFPGQSFTLAPDQRKVIEDVPDKSYIVGGIKVRGLSGMGKGKSATFKRFKRAENFDVEVEVDKDGILRFDKEIFHKGMFQ